MKRHLRMSLVLVALCLALVCIFAGCNDELEAKVDKNATDAAAAVDAAAEKALADLNAAKAELNKLISDGTTAASEALATKAGELNTAIEAAKKAATDADAALKAELNTAIVAAQTAAEKKASDNLAAAKAELKTAIDANAANLSTEVEDLNAAIEAAKTVAAGDTAALKAELEAAIQAAAEAAQTNLDNAKAALEAAISEQGEELTRALGDLATAIGVANETAEAANDALAEEIYANMQKGLDNVANQINYSLDMAVQTLNKSIDANAATVESEVARLEELIEAAKTVAANANDALAEEIYANMQKGLDNVANQINYSLDMAVQTLNKSIANKADAATLTSEIERLAGLIENAETVAANANDALAEEIYANMQKGLDNVADQINYNLDMAVQTLNKSIDTKADAATLTAAKEELDNNILTINSLITALQGTDASLRELIDINKAAIDAAITAGMQIADWNDATTEIATKVYAQYVAKKAEYDVFAAIDGLYSDDQVALIDSLATEYYIRIMRAATVEAANEAYTAYAEALGAIPSITDVVYTQLVEVNKDGVTVEDEAALRAIKEAIDNIYAMNNSEITKDMEQYKTADGVEPAFEGSLVETYETYWADVNGQLVQDEGEALKAEIDNYLTTSGTITADELDDLNALLAKFQDWLTKETVGEWTKEETVYTNSMTLEGYEVADWDNTRAALNEAIERATLLQTFAADVEALNNKIVAQGTELTNEGPKEAVLTNINTLQAEYEALVAKYFAGAYAADKVETNENYNTIKHTEMAALHTDFAAKLAAFQEAVADFVDAIAVLKNTNINLFAYDEIAAAYDAYAPHAATFQASLDYVIYVNPDDAEDVLTATEAVTLLKSADDNYKAIKATALANYNAVIGGIAGKTPANVTLYDDAAIQDVLGWYANSAINGTVWVDGEPVFANNNGDVGYVLSDELTILESNYNEVVLLDEAWIDLDTAKKAEKNALEQAITDLGTITLNDKTAIEAAEAAYTAWLNGANAPEGYTAAQFAIDGGSDKYVISNYADLTAARTTWDSLNATMTELVADIEALATIVNAADFETQSVEKDTYAADIAALETRIAEFVAANGGDDEDYITEAHYNKLATGKLACTKYDKVADVNALTADTKGYDCSAAINAIKANAIATIEGATTVDAMTAAYTDAQTRINNIATAAANTAENAARVNACANLTADTVAALNKNLTDLLAAYATATVTGTPATDDAKNDAIADLAEVANTANVDAKLNAEAEKVLTDAANAVATGADIDETVALATAKINGCDTMADTYNTYATNNPDKVTAYDNALNEMLARMLGAETAELATQIANQLDATLAAE